MRSRRPNATQWAASGAGLIGALVALVQLRHGIVPLLDTVTYWSGAESIASGHLLRTTLVPSFSNFDAVDFLERGGSLPFVDFPIAYPLLAGSIGIVAGTRGTMQALTVAAVGLISACIVWGAAPLSPMRRKPTRMLYVAGFAALVPLLPALRLVTQGALSEPLFIVCSLGLVVALARFRAGGRWLPVVALTILGSLLRFLGAPLGALAGWEYYRRTKSVRRSLLWTAGMVAPAGLNILGASAAGGGHSAGWRGLDRLDIEVFVRSVGGWFDASQGDIRRTYFTADGPAWWSWLVSGAVFAVMVVAVIAVARQRRAFTDTADLALSAAAVLIAGLFAGILGFDALVIADNRLMLPAGILVISAAVWTIAERAPSSRSHIWLALLALVLWGTTAVRPWNALERFSDIDRPLEMSRVVAGLDARVVISDDADGVHWDTGIPVAYTPMAVKPLTGEIVDDVAVYRALPCALLRADGAVVISSETTFSTVNREALDVEVLAGRLTAVATDAATVFLPSSSACD